MAFRGCFSDGKRYMQYSHDKIDVPFMMIADINLQFFVRSRNICNAERI